MKNDFLIRLMTDSDYEEAFQLWHDMPGVGMRSIDDSKTGINRFLARNPDTCYVAVNNGVIIGTILCGHDGRRGYIYHAAVKPEFQRTGVGKALVEASLEALKKEGINKAALVVFASNYYGIRFWSSMGFEIRQDLDYMNISLNDANY